MKAIDMNAREVGRAYQIFGISRTNKNVLAMRGTTPDKLAARLITFKRDKDTGVVLVDMEQLMHKTQAAAVLATNNWFLDRCVAAGHNRDEVTSFLQRVGGQAMTVARMPRLDEAATAPQVEQQQEPEQQEQEDEARCDALMALPQVEQQQEPEQEDEARCDALMALPQVEQQQEPEQQEPEQEDVTALLEQQEQQDLEQLEQPEESVEQSRRKGRRRA